MTEVLLLQLVPKGGGVPRDPTVENHFPSQILQWNLHHICMDYKKSQFCNKKIEKLYRFKMAAKQPIFILRHFDFGQNLKKKKKTLSQRNFSMKFGSK